MTDDRMRDIIGTVKTITDRHVFTLPVDIEALCRMYGAKMTTVDEAVAMGLDRETLMSCMGNRDGVATRGRKGWGIIYNKNAPINRLRFTLAEEFMHTVLGHTLDPRFNALDPSYSEDVYRQYEEEAKVAAGLLLVPPRVWQRYGRVAGVGGVGKLCGVSDSCMYTWLRVMKKYAEIMNKYAKDIGVGVMWESIGTKADRRGRTRAVLVEYNGSC